jgi:flagellar protein FliO/FliZ
MTAMERGLLALLGLYAGLATAAPEKNIVAVTDASSFGRVVVSLSAVIGLLMCVAWYAKKTGGRRAVVASAIKIVGGVNVGRHEKVLVVEVADQWIVVGVGSGNIQALSTMSRPSGEAAAGQTEQVQVAGFRSWLTKAIDKRSSTKNEG